MIMSRITLEKSEGDAVAVEVHPAEAKKCERCWHYVEGVGENAEHPTLCPRCISNLFGSGEVRRIA